MTMSAPVTMSAFLASLNEHGPLDRVAFAATSDETEECSGCEHCDGEGGHSVADSKRAYAATAHYLANKASIDSQEDAREARKAALEGDVEGGPRAMTAGIRAYLKAGKAVFTLVSLKTGTRFTFKVRAAKADGRDPIWFVSVLTGSNNEADYTYLGTINAKGYYTRGARSTISAEAPSAKAFAWAFEYLVADKVPPQSEFWHSGSCAKCGRKLTDPQSLAIGLGPKCAGE